MKRKAFQNKHQTLSLTTSFSTCKRVQIILVGTIFGAKRKKKSLKIKIKFIMFQQVSNDFISHNSVLLQVTDVTQGDSHLTNKAQKELLFVHEFIIFFSKQQY